ncbi:dihydrofolate reductase family protein [Actinopolymorpha sp. NPDC004070]|uniref:dihydrofolate reductase family protein n=1 Tax=Actinopolymorpha sp. NPDC004070 TaxID=3154548 RepID=UPI0033BE5A0C
MKIKTHLGISVDGFIASEEGWPSQALMPTFVPGVSHGHPDFIAGCTAVLIGRNTFEAGLGAPRWPWPGHRVFVLTSQPLPDGALSDVVAVSTPELLLKTMQDSDLGGDVHLVGGQRTLAAFLALDAVDSLGVVVLPLLLGRGVPFSVPSAGRRNLTLTSTRALPDGSVENTYTRGTQPGQ